MANTYSTPGVYIEEKNTFSGSAVAVETAVPVFIGYTEKADRKGKSLLNKPTRITSLAMYAEYFGGGIKSQFIIADPDDKSLEEEKIIINGNPKVIKFKDDKKRAMMYNALRLFYNNGGSACYILSIGNYGGDGLKNFDVKAPDFNKKIFSILEKEFEPTLVVIPDIILKGKEAYNVYRQVLEHCQKMQNRFGLFDVYHTPGNTIDADIQDFRDGIGSRALNYGAAYYPFLKASVVQPDELDIQNLDLNFLSLTLPGSTGTLALDGPGDKVDSTTSDPAISSPESKSKPKENAKTAASDTSETSSPKANVNEDKDSNTNGKTAQKLNIKVLRDNLPELKVLDLFNKIDLRVDATTTDIVNYHQSLVASSPTYVTILEEMRRQLNELPPSAAMAGVYTYTDTTRGVWKSPANISVSMVNEPTINISNEEQQNLNVDAVTGKSINVIRSFPGFGTLVWGARTLDGNSKDWRYINVRRTLIMIEQSIKLATRAYVFEANDANTWVTVTSMINNFLYNLWKQGALAGATPEQAYNVQLGLGSTMTPDDILEGIMRISIHLAIVRPAEFIVITFQQQQQQS